MMPQRSYRFFVYSCTLAHAAHTRMYILGAGHCHSSRKNARTGYTNIGTNTRTFTDAYQLPASTIAEDTKDRSRWYLSVGVGRRPTVWNEVLRLQSMRTAQSHTRTHPRRHRQFRVRECDGKTRPRCGVRCQRLTAVFFFCSVGTGGRRLATHGATCVFRDRHTHTVALLPPHTTTDTSTVCRRRDVLV